MNTIDDQIKKMFAIVQAKREAVELAEQSSKDTWKTKASILIGKETTPQSIQTASAEKVKQIVMELLRHRQLAKEANNILGINEDEEEKYQGFTYEDWFVDCRKRMNALTLKEKQKQLNILEDRLNAIVSPEQRRAMELESISKELGI